jgi:hypothetical protein
MREVWPFLCLQRMAPPRLMGQSMQGQRSISGAETVRATMRGYWVVEAQLIVSGYDATLQLEAFLAGMEGRVGTTLVPIESWTRATDRDGHLATQRLTAPLADGGTFEHWGFDAPSSVQAVVMEGAAVRATQLRFTLGNTTGLRPGQRFSIGERMYSAQRVWEDEASRIVQFQPPLREAVYARDVIVLDKVQCVMRLVDDRVAFDPRRPLIQPITLNFEESI